MVIAIISILAGLLLPALHKARKQAVKISCLNNLKQFGTAMFIYFGENNGNLPIATLHNGATRGDFGTNYTFREIFRLIGQRFRDPIKKDNGENHRTGDEALTACMRFDPPRVAVCPARDPSSYLRTNLSDPGWANLSRQTYAMFSFGARNITMNEEKLLRGFKSTNRPGSGPALFADRCNITASATDGLAATNHMSADKKTPEGGNVLHLAGSVKWFPYAGDYDVKDAYVMEGGLVGGSYSIPSNAFFPWVGDPPDVDLTTPSNNFIGGKARLNYRTIFGSM